MWGVEWEGGAMSTKFEEVTKRLDGLERAIQTESNDARICLANGMLALAYALTFVGEVIADNDGLNIHLTTHKGK